MVVKSGLRVLMIIAASYYFPLATLDAPQVYVRNTPFPASGAIHRATCRRLRKLR